MLLSVQKRLILFLFSTFFFAGLSSQQTQIVYLSGTGSDNTVDWEFFCTGGRNSGEWTTIPVPSCWELQGFGTYNYAHDKDKADESGQYRYSFEVPADYKDKKVEIVFVGSMTDTEVKINGSLAGPIHQGAFYQFDYDISSLLNYGEKNLLEVKVDKMSSNESVNAAERKADYWIFGGIFRPVYLRILPKENIDRVAIDAKADGSFYSDVFLDNLEKSNRIEVVITDLEGNISGSTSLDELEKGQEKAGIQMKIENPELWSPEYPNLYNAVFRLYRKNELVHEYVQRFGFRTVEVIKEDGIYVNGAKIMFRGVNRHSFWPGSGRTLNKELCIIDVNLMKDMNMNAVRMSHYPPDPHFLDVCDSLGLFVLNELAGWQRPPYDTKVGKKLVREMVTRDVNHPSIVLWDNGNEGGWNTELDNEFAKYDPQKRKVIHPWMLFNGMDTKHYRDWDFGMNTLFHGRDIFFPTEFLHGLYDGGHGAGLEDFWNSMVNNPRSAGGFLWVFSDEGVVRTDMDGWIDTQKSNAPDGIVGPYREKEGSFFTIKEIWSPVHHKMDFIPVSFKGLIELENRFFYTNLRDCFFEVSIENLKVHFNTINTTKTYPVTMASVKPGEKGILDLNLPSDWRNYDVLTLKATDPHGREIMTWSWPVKTPENFSSGIKSGEYSTSHKVEAFDNQDHFILSSGNKEVTISRNSGLIEKIRIDGEDFPLSGGPYPSHDTLIIKEISSGFTPGGDYRLSFKTEGGLNDIIYQLSSDGWLMVESSIKGNGRFDYMGVDFYFPESEVKSVELVADGPYRVWKNRLKGPQFGLWHKEYNNTITGESWVYPEFKGYYSNFYRMKVNTTTLPLTVMSGTQDLYLKLYNPEPPKGAYNENTNPAFSKGDISFLQGISPIGTKFKNPEQIGPMGQKNNYGAWADDKPHRSVLYFYFGELK